MRFYLTFPIAIGFAAATLGGCANDPGLTTASVVKPPVPTAVVDPQCATLRDQIAAVQGEGTVGRVEQAATGGTKTVVIKRGALAKVAELNRLNSEYRSKCSNPSLLTATATPVSTAATVTATTATAAQTAATQAATAVAQQRAATAARTAVAKATQ